MTFLRMDIERRARLVVRDLNQIERAALGTEILLSVSEPEAFLSLWYAARLVRERAEQLKEAALHIPGAEPRAVLQPEATTHEQSEPKGGPCVGRLRTACQVIQDAERRFSESIWGDMLGGLCLFVFGIGVVIAAGVLQ